MKTKIYIFILFIILSFICYGCFIVKVSRENNICCCSNELNYCFNISPSLKYILLKKHKLILNEIEYKELMSLKTIMYSYEINTIDTVITDISFVKINNKNIEDKLRKYIIENVGCSYKIHNKRYKLSQTVFVSDYIWINENENPPLK